MKKLLVVLFLLCSVSAFAQDVIVKKDGSTIVCRVEKVSETDVTYKLWSDLKGSSYVMDKSLVSAINYENGKKETFNEAESLYKPNNQNDGVQALNDKALLKMDYETDRAYKKVKRLRTWGWIGGAVLVAGGAAIMGALGVTDTHGYGYSEDVDMAVVGGGVACMVAGIGLTTTCLLVANKQKKKIDSGLLTSPIYRYDIPFSNGSSLSVGADMLRDNIMRKQTIGLGLSYNF